MIGRHTFLGALFLYLATTTAFAEDRRPDHPFFCGLPAEGAWVAAHRGGMHLWPENTLLAFERALELGVHMLEMDVRITADGVPVVIHDETVNRTTDGAGRVSGMTFQELRRLDAGYRWENTDNPGVRPWKGKGLQVPTLEEVFEAFPDARIVLEIKENSPALVRSVGDLIERHGRQQLTLVASFKTPVLKSFRMRHPEVATSAGRSEVFRFWLSRKKLVRNDGEFDFLALQIPRRFRGIPLVTTLFVQAALRQGLSVQVWTINDVDYMRWLFETGVDAVITDRPDLALKIAATAGQEKSR